MTTTASSTVHHASRSLTGKTALITGAASGLGASLARLLGECGAAVVGVDIQARRLADGMAALRERGVDARGVSADIADPRGASQAVAEAAAVSGRLDILVNNAGTDLTVPLEALSDADWQRIIGTNLNGPFLLSRAALPYMRGHAARQQDDSPGDAHVPDGGRRDDQLDGDRMRGKHAEAGLAGEHQAGAALAGGGEHRVDRLHGERIRGGHIINIASTAAKRAWPNASAYHASKWGLLGFSHALHAELRSQDIRVTAVVAGGMRTPFLLERFPELDAGSLQDPDDVAGAILSVLLLPPNAVVAELTILPLRETSWP